MTTILNTPTTTTTRVPGSVHLPGDPAYDAAVIPWNLAVRQQPAAVATPTTAAEVADPRDHGRALLARRAGRTGADPVARHPRGAGPAVLVVLHHRPVLRGGGGARAG